MSTPIAAALRGQLTRIFTFSHPAIDAPDELDIILMQVIDDRVEAKLASREEENRRNKMVDSTEGAALLGISEDHLLRLRRRNSITGTRQLGTRRLYFRVGDLLDWKEANTREDGELKHTSRKSVPGAKQKGR